MVRAISLLAITYLCWIGLLCSTSAQDFSGEFSNEIQKLTSIGSNPTTEEIIAIVQMSSNETRVTTDYLLPGPSLTVADYVAEKVKLLRGNNRLKAAILETFQRDDVTQKQFAVLLKVFHWEELSDAESARLQTDTLRLGNEFVVILLNELGRNSAKIGEQFDLLIDAAIHSEEIDTIVAGCRAIINRENRVLVWNARLIELMKGPLEGRLAIAPDFLLKHDFRSIVLRALRVNGYPSNGFVEFLSTWSTKPGSELYFQKLATSYVVLGKVSDLREIVDSLFIREWRDAASKVLCESVLLPEAYRQEILKAALHEEDVAARRLTRLFVEQFGTDGLSTQELERLEARMSLNFRKRYKKSMHELDASSTRSGENE